MTGQVTAPVPCPRCGRQPRLRVSFVNAADCRQSRYVFKLECRRWRGLVRCFGPHRENWTDKDGIDIGPRVAVERWNDAVAKSRSNPQPQPHASPSPGD